MQQLNLKSARFWKDFAAASFWGALVGALPYLMISVPFGLLAGVASLFKGESVGPLLLMPLPLLIAYPVTFAVLLFCGLPIYALMARRGAVRPLAFAIIGALIGVVLFEIFMGRWDWDVLRLYMGASAGGVAGYFLARAMARQIADQPS